jgi:hypothetical protein
MSCTDTEKIVRDLLKSSTEDTLYADKILFNLGLHSSHEVKNFLRMMLYNKTSNWALSKGEKSNLTKRTRRVWNVLDPIVIKSKSYKGPGVYRVSAGWTTSWKKLPICYIYSETQQEARDVSKILFSYLCGENESLVIAFDYYGLLPDALKKNEQAIDKYKDNLEMLLTKLSKTQNEIEMAKIRLSSLQTIRDQQKD